MNDGGLKVEGKEGRGSEETKLAIDADIILWERKHEQQVVLGVCGCEECQGQLWNAEFPVEQSHGQV